MLGTKLTYPLVTLGPPGIIVPSLAAGLCRQPSIPDLGSRTCGEVPLWRCPARPDISWPRSWALSLQGYPQEIMEELGDGEDFCISLNRGRFTRPPIGRGCMR